jgi:hypothetical protein
VIGSATQATIPKYPVIFSVSGAKNFAALSPGLEGLKYSHMLIMVITMVMMSIIKRIYPDVIRAEAAVIKKATIAIAADLIL